MMDDEHQQIGPESAAPRHIPHHDRSPRMSAPDRTSSLYPNYPEAWPACIMCGAKTGEPCTVISTAHDDFYDQDAGDRRESPHSARAKPGQEGPKEPFVAVKDEPDYRS